MPEPAADAQGEAAGRPAALELVVAVAENDAIGRDNRLPWRLPADLRRFKALTLGHPILMGRKTHESIGRALPGRTNLILTRTRGFRALECIVVHSLADACAAAGAEASIMVIGGAEIYRLCLPLATRLHLTLVHTRIEGADACFDGWRSADWVESSREPHEADDRNECAYSFVTLDRRVPA